VKARQLLGSILVLVSTAIWFAGCGHDTPVSSNMSQLPTIIDVSPPDGATGIESSATITIQFDMPMAPESVMANFCLSGGDEMHEWMDSLAHHHGPGGGHMMDMDQMMEWMHGIEMPGEYHWNEDHDFCEFVPDGGMMPDTEYMLFVNGGMRSHTGELMRTHHLRYEGYMYHFRTAP
jgi:hypothetical protein